MKKTFILLFVFAISLTMFNSCKKDKTLGILKGTVTDLENSATLSDVRIEIYFSDSNSPTDKVLITSSNGTYEVELSAGTYYLKLYKQGYNSIPVQGGSAIPVTVYAEEETTSDYEMSKSSVQNAGFISGTISGAENNSGVLIIAEDGTNGYSSVSDVDGNYVIYNIPAGSYTIKGWKTGCNSTEINTTVTASQETTDQDITLTENASVKVNGTVTFLATNNGEVDVTLTHPITKETIPGLSTRTEAGNYEIVNVPNGNYILRATFENDNYVVDPDWIIKFGEPVAEVNNANVTINFSVTGSVLLSSPTNDSTSTQPLEISATTPTFEWFAYSSTSDYVIEVSDVNGNVIWGGFTKNGDTITKNVIIPKDQLSVQYNFDGTATLASLVPGKTYRWRIYSSKDDTQDFNGWKLISVSEDQRGLIKISE